MNDRTRVLGPGPVPVSTAAPPSPAVAPGDSERRTSRVELLWDLVPTERAGPRIADQPPDGFSAPPRS